MLAYLLETACYIIMLYSDICFLAVDIFYVKRAKKEYLKQHRRTKEEKPYIFNPPAPQMVSVSNPLAPQMVSVFNPPPPDGEYL